MGKQWYQLKVQDVVEETDEAKTLILDVPEDQKDQFQYRCGQFLNIRISIDGELEERSYSLSSPGKNEDLRITVKKIDDGKVSSHIVDKVRSGIELECTPPEGRFTIEPRPEERRVHYFMAAGSGITPIFSLINELLESEPKSQIHLLYGNRTPEDTIFKNELDDLAEQYRGQLFIKYVFSRMPKPKWNIFKIDDSEPWHGRIDKKKVAKWLRKNDHRGYEAVYYICGPGSMNQDLYEYLKQSGIPSKHIRVESFITAEDRKESGTSESSWKLKATLDGQQYEFEIMGDKPVLEALLDEGVDAPHSCTSGACATCMALLKKGNVEMDVDFALSDEEKEDGYVLTCQSRARSEEVEVDYDI